MTDILRTSLTRRCFVAGTPIAHSRSPMIHGHWMCERGMDAIYESIETAPEALPLLLDRVRAGSFVGGNLTIPLKQIALPYLDAVTPEAAAMGAVNTVFMKNGQLWGANTDVPGFFAHLDQEVPQWDAAKPDVLVIGAGGAARAIVYGLLGRSTGKIRVTNRSQERVTALFDAFASHPGSGRLCAEAWPPTARIMQVSQIVINATSLGMVGQPPLELEWPSDSSAMIACDAVYVPLTTRFLAEAAARGAKPVDGLGMLLHQAALAFAFWFGVTPAVTQDLRAMIEADLVPPRADNTP